MSKMLSNIVRFFLFCAVFGISQSAIIDTLPKCPAKDTKCQKELFQNTLYKTGETGIPELNIPPYDPIYLENISFSVLNLVNITLIDGIAKGIKDCVFEEFSTDFEKSVGVQIMVCDVVIKGHYKVSVASPVIETILSGNELHAEGKAKVKIEKIRIEFIFPFTTKRRDDGEIYVKCKLDEIQKKFDVLGKVTFAADKIFFGKEDISRLVIYYLNDNWRFVMNSFGKIFYDKAAEIYFSIAGKFFDSVPARYYISDDLTPYLTN